MSGMTERNQIEALVAKARTAQAIVETYDQERVDLIAGAIVYHLSREQTASDIAEMAFAETGMGLVDGKRAKLTHKMPAILHDILQEPSVDVIDRNAVTGITTITCLMV